MSIHKIPQAELPAEGQHKKFELGDDAILVACVEGKYYATGLHCTHWGGPLNEGVMHGHCVMCPWHHALFDLRTGHPVEPPALDNIDIYSAKLENGELVVDMTPLQSSAPAAGAKEDINIIIVGGGAAGQAAAEELRYQGFDGQITILSSSDSVAVDRPNLSKDYLAGNADPAWIPLRAPEWYEENDVEIRLNTTVSGVDTSQNRVKLSSGETLNYHKLLLATGGKPRQLPIPGHDLENVFQLREWKDAKAILEAAKQAKNAVIIGSSFIGMEVASSLASGHGINVSVISTDKIPFERVLGPEIGTMLQSLHSKNSINFHLNSSIKEFLGEDGTVNAARLASGEEIPADIVIVGVGVSPNTAFLQDSGLDMGQDKSVLTDEYLRSSNPDIFAAGDIARWSDSSGADQRIEHWRVALQQGKIAARNILGQNDSVAKHVPFFWTAQWGTPLGYVGHATNWDEIVYRNGTPSDGEFLAYFVKDNKVLAAVGVNRGDRLEAIEMLIQQGKLPDATQVTAPDFDPVALLQAS